ncbi:MAG: hypothetical protein PVG66_02130 [Chromatiales bacterium]|jgi:hypothetical protein
MNQPQEFRVDKKRLFLLALFSLLTLSSGALLFNESAILGSIAVGVSGLIFLVLLYLIISNSMSLSVDKNGIISQTIWGKRELLWEDINDIYLTRIRLMQVMLITFNDKYLKKNNRSCLWDSVSAKEAAFPNIYDSSLEEIVDSISMWKYRSISDKTNNAPNK